MPPRSVPKSRSGFAPAARTEADAMRVVLTRPAQDADPWSVAMQAHGHEPLVLPLIAILPVDDTAPLRAAWQQLDRYAAAMFVSANAVRQFRACAPDAAWPARTRAWATGPGTSGALLRAGVPRERIDVPSADAQQFDSEALWSLVESQAQAGTRVLIVRGADEQGRLAGREWLADTLASRGVHVDAIATYRRGLPEWDEARKAQARKAASDGSVWLLSSSEAIGNLRRLVPGTDWSAARAIATHERIAAAAREAGFGVVRPSRPSVDAVVAALESIR